MKDSDVIEENANEGKDEKEEKNNGKVDGEKLKLSAENNKNRVEKKNCC